MHHSHLNEIFLEEHKICIFMQIYNFLILKKDILFIYFRIPCFVTGQCAFRLLRHIQPEPSLHIRRTYFYGGEESRIIRRRSNEKPVWGSPLGYFSLRRRSKRIFVLTIYLSFSASWIEMAENRLWFCPVPECKASSTPGS